MSTLLTASSMPPHVQDIMRLATIDSVATTQTLRNNLQNLGVFAVMIRGNIDKINAEFDTNYSQLLA